MSEETKADSIWRNPLDEKVVMVDPNTLLEHPDNWRIHPDHQRKILEGSLNDLGWVKPVHVSKRTNVIYDGHARVFAAKSHGELVPVLYADLSPGDERKALTALDSFVSLAETDWAALDRNLRQIEELDEDFAALFDGIEQETARTLETTAKLEEEGNANFSSIKKSFKERKVVIKAIYALADAETVERALEATENINRAEALTIIAEHYLKTKGERTDDQEGGQHEPGAESEFEAELNRALA